jgi:hypothetical protein
MAVVKLSFNGCIYSDGISVTLRFSDVVGEILTGCPSERE